MAAGTSEGLVRAIRILLESNDPQAVKVAAALERAKARNETRSPPWFLGNGHD